MAYMYPDRLDPNTESRAERELYSELRDQLPERYHVFHSVAWQSRSPHYGARDGEADFVIVDPQHGLLVVEAKSGAIRYDGRQGEWYQNERTMDKDPVEQAKRSVYHLVHTTLQEQPYWKRREFVYGHAVAFTDIVGPDHALLLKLPREILLDKRDLQNLTASVQRVFDHYRGERRIDGIDKHGIQYLVELLAPERNLRSLLGVDIKGEAAEFVRLRERQYRVLDYLARMPRVAIAGCAGSGKTMLAAEKARRLAGRGWRVLLTCYNRNLAEFLKHDYLAERPDTLDIDNFHKAAMDLVRRSGQQTLTHFKDDSQRGQYFSDELPDQLVGAVDLLGPQYDAIVVDEAQDFQDNWWLPLQLLLEDPDEGVFYLFYDDNQNIYGGEQRVKNLAHSVPLHENCRNTQRIHDQLLHFYSGEHEISALGPEGRDVELITYDSSRDMSDKLRRALHRLIQDEAVPPDDIVILTPRSPEKSRLSRVGRFGNVYLSRNWDTDYNEIFYTTIHSFKGLESPVIILTELDADVEHAVDELLYVGCSRARHHLVVLCDEAVVERFRTP